MAVAREVLVALKPRVQGVLVTTSPGGIDRALDVLD
jgi:hypothetical protein